MINHKEEEMMRELKIHVKKCVQPYFICVQDGSKNYEVRLNDCEYREGDLLIQREWHEKVGFAGEITFHKIGWITDFEQKDNYVEFSLITPTVKEITTMYDFMVNKLGIK